MLLHKWSGERVLVLGHPSLCVVYLGLPLTCQALRAKNHPMAPYRALPLISSTSDDRIAAATQDAGNWQVLREVPELRLEPDSLPLIALQREAGLPTG